MEFEVIRYLENPLSTQEIEELLKALDIPPIDLVRKNEAIWKSDYRGKALSDSQIIAALAENPKLIERPVVLKDGRAVVARPADKISELL